MYKANGKYKKEEVIENRKQWIAALRSGKYTQTEGALHSSRGMCCLGVACHTLGVPKVEMPDEDTMYTYYLGQHELLPPNAVRMLGMYQEAGSFETDRELEAIVQTLYADEDAYDEKTRKLADIYGYGSLVEANDTGKFTFNDIANFIETYPEVVFKWV